MCTCAVYLLVWVYACGGQRQTLDLSSVTLDLYFLRPGLCLTEISLAKLAHQPMSLKDLMFPCSLSHMSSAGVKGVLYHMPKVLDVFWGSKLRPSQLCNGHFTQVSIPQPPWFL